MNEKIKTNEMPSINQRLFMLVKEFTDNNVNKFVELINFNKHQNFNRLFHRDTRNNKYPKPSAEILNCIKINLPQVNYDWLLTGEGEMLKIEKQNEQQRFKQLEFDFQKFVELENTHAETHLKNAETNMKHAQSIEKMIALLEAEKKGNLQLIDIIKDLHSKRPAAGEYPVAQMGE
jgi:hypothetical protein